MRLLIFSSVQFSESFERCGGARARRAASTRMPPRSRTAEFASGARRSFVQALSSSKSIGAAEPIEGFATRRAAVSRVCSDWPQAGTSGQVVPWGLDYAECPKSFGNHAQATLAHLALALAFGAAVGRSDAGLPVCRRESLGGGRSEHMNCRNYIRSVPKEGCGPAGDAVNQSTPKELDSVLASVSATRNQTRRARGFESTLGALRGARLPPGTRVSVNGGRAAARTLKAIFGQAMAPLHGHSDDASQLFGLGPHVAYGTLFTSAFAFSSELEEALRPRPDELRIGVHARHFDDTHNGSENIGALEQAVAFEVRRLRAGKRALKCAILLASDRRLLLQLFEPVAARLKCRLLVSARSRPARDYMAEHGEDTGAVAIRDLQMLSTSHVLVGSWYSSFTLLALELVAAGYSGGHWLPTVQFCSIGAKCTRPLPLITERTPTWYVSSESGFKITEISRSNLPNP